MIELPHYLTADGYDPFQAWLDALKGKDRHAAMRVLTRLNRLAVGNPGDSKPVGVEGWNCESTMAQAIACITPR